MFSLQVLGTVAQLERALIYVANVDWKDLKPLMGRVSFLMKR